MAETTINDLLVLSMNCRLNQQHYHKTKMYEEPFWYFLNDYVSVNPHGKVKPTTAVMQIMTVKAMLFITSRTPPFQKHPRDS